MISPRWRRFVLIILAVLAAGCATTDRGRYRQTLGQTRSEISTTTEATALIDLATARKLSETWEFRAADRSLRRASITRTPDGKSRSTTLTHQPTFDLRHASNLFDIDLSADRRWSSQSGSDFDNTLVRDNVFGRVIYHPSNLPTISFQSEQTDSSDDRNLDTTLTRSIFRVDHTLEDFNFFTEFTRQSLDDRRIRQVQDRDDLVAGLNSRYASEDGMLDSTISLFHSRYKITERGATDGLGQLPLTNGLFDIDNTPTLGTLPVNTQLIDGDLLNGAGIQIGGIVAGGGVDRNIGFDQGPIPRDVEEIYLYTDNPFTLAEAGQFDWSVYSSSDNVSWKLERFSAPTRYDTGRQRFEIALNGLAARYIKVVNTTHAPAAPSVQVSEIRAIGREGGLVNGTEEEQNRVDVSVSLRPSENWSVLLDGGVGKTQRNDQGRLSKDERATRFNISSTYQPLYWLLATVRVGREDLEDPRLVSQLTNSYSGTIGFLPNERLSFDVSALRRDEDRDNRPYTRNDALTGRASASFDHDILASLQISKSEQQEFLTNRVSNRDTVQATMNAPVRDDLMVRLEEQIDLLTVHERGLGQTETNSKMTGAEFVYRPSDLLTVLADYEYWTEALTNTGLTQRYQIDWLPFSTGQLLIQLDFQRRAGGAMRGPSETTFAQIRWTLERTTFLDLTTIWTKRTSSSGQIDRVRSLTLTLSVDF